MRGSGPGLTGSRGAEGTLPTGPCGVTGTLPFQLESPEDTLRAMQTPLTAQQAVGGTSHFQMDYADDR